MRRRVQLDKPDEQETVAGGSRGGMVTAAIEGTDSEDDLEPESVPPKKQAPAASRSSKKTTETKRGEQDRIATEYQKASAHPDILQASARGKRAATEAPHEPGTSSPKKVCLYN